ncbi:hypothetical protein [Streptomyces sp. NPDC085932]|uniref:hypothetical protein n=1 Tax=Streptomyces sp. NPDC085932 TaxID=3365741 RepID=UPI0037D896A8
MTVPPALAATGPLGLVAASASSTVYSIVKDLNSSLSFETTSPTPLHAIPDALKDALVDEDLGERAVSGVFYTHSRFQPIVRQWKHFTHFVHRHGNDDVPEGANQSHSIFMILPLRMSYNAVRLDTTYAQEELMKRAEESYAKADQIDVDAEQDRIDELTRLLGQHRYGNARAQRQLETERRQHQRRLDSYDVHSRAADRLVQEAHRLRDSGSPVYMKNFKIRLVEQVNGIKARTAAGLHGKGTMVVTTKQMPAAGGSQGRPRLGFSVQFDWHEDNLFGHSYDWHGFIDLGCNDQGTPEVLGGNGKFYTRFLQHGVIE